MTESPTMDFVEGQGSTRLDFGDLDMRYFLKIRAHINLAMPPVFRDLARRFDMLRLGKEGVVPLMYYVKMEVAPVALAFGREITSEHRIGIHRHLGEGARGPTERLLLDSRTVFRAHGGAGSPGVFGWEEHKGELLEAGRAEVLQVFTRPMAPPGERGVSELPATFRALRVQPWDEPYPTIEGFQEIPAGFQEAPPGAWQESTSVWGVPNTDINQHVNVMEYIGGMEDQFTRLVHGSEIPPLKHFVSHAQLIFRKPFFPGDPYAVRGRLWLDGARTLMVGGIHAIESDGRPSERPSVAARYEGTVLGE